MLGLDHLVKDITESVEKIIKLDEMFTLLRSIDKNLKELVRLQSKGK